MKTLWTMLSVIAVANMLALGGLVAWLGATDRLDLDRVRRAREVLSETRAAEKTRLEKEQAARDAETKTAAAAVAAKLPPVTTADVLQVKVDGSKIDQERAAALRKEIEILRDTLTRQITELARAKDDLDRRRAEFDIQQKRIAETEGTEQFKKTLETYEGLKPDKAKAALSELIKQDDIQQVVGYLNAMEDRTRTRIVEEFIKEDPKLAADLLERLRTRGQLAAVPEGSP